MVDLGARPVGRISLPDLIEREENRRKRGRRTRIVALVAAALLAAGAWLALRPRPVPLAARFRLAPISTGDVLREVRAAGHVEAVQTVEVGAEVSGRLAAVDADFNQHVVKGQVLARFDRSSLLSQVAQARAAAAASEAAAAQAELDAEHAVNDLTRAERLHIQRLSSDAEYETAFVAARVAGQQLRAARSQVVAQRAALELARVNLSRTEIRAPIDGVVVSRNVDPGQTLASVFQTPVLFTVAADLKKMRVLAAVDEADVGEVARGQLARFTVNAWPSRWFAGAVTEVRNAPAIVQDVVTYQAVIEVGNDELLLKPGMSAAVRIRTASAKEAPRVPAAALRFTPPGELEHEDAGLWLLENGALRWLQVRAGVSDGEWTEVSGAPPAAQVLVELSPAGRKAYGLAH